MPKTNPIPRNPIPAWIEDAAIYHIYPQSFKDSNGDGIGDLPGIVEKLGYLKELGITCLWLGPIFDSPFGDAGYDVRDFHTVAPRYGTREDLMNLFQAAHAVGIRVVLDLVAGHTSMDNLWFQEEAKAPLADSSHRYIWKNRSFDPDSGPDKEDFVSNFFWHQPALNYGYAQPTEAWMDPVDAPGPQRNRAALREIISQWMDLGCDGFRVDMAASLVKADPDKAATIALWQEIRDWFSHAYPEGILVAEWSDPKVSVPAGFHLDFMMHFHAPGYPSLFFNGHGVLPDSEGPCYFSADGNGDPRRFMEEYRRQLDAVDGQGYVSLPSANHDFQRWRCGPRTREELRGLWVFLLTQKGPPTLYYGDEIGMRHVPGLGEKEGSTLWGVTAANAGKLGGGNADGERSGTRTPMQWDDSLNAGFSTAVPENLYLPVDPAADRPTVQDQLAGSGSLLHFVRDLLAFRKANPVLGSQGTYTWMEHRAAYPLIVQRHLDEQRFWVVLNPSGQEQRATIGTAHPLNPTRFVDGVSWNSDPHSITFTLQPFAYGILESVLPKAISEPDFVDRTGIAL